MAQVERAKEARESTKRLKAKETRGRRRSNSDPANFLSSDYAAILGLMASFADAGGAVRYGYTRDGGAYALGIYLGDDYSTEYIRPNEDFTGACLEIAEAWLPNNGAEFHRIFNLLKTAQEGT